jgi:hypothetical protein
MGSECHHWGYWDEDDDRRFNWAIAGDPLTMEMRKLVTEAKLGALAESRFAQRDLRHYARRLHEYGARI